MTLLREVAGELLGMFLADARLTGAILVLVALVAALVLGLDVSPAIAGGVLMGGCLAILVEAALREARLRRRAEASIGARTTE